MFWATPQAYDHEDLIWFQQQLGRNVARATDRICTVRSAETDRRGGQLMEAAELLNGNQVRGNSEGVICRIGAELRGTRDDHHGLSL